jgi:hypothetical protein
MGVAPKMCTDRNASGLTFNFKKKKGEKHFA